MGKFRILVWHRTVIMKHQYPNCYFQNLGCYCILKTRPKYYNFCVSILQNNQPFWLVHCFQLRTTFSEVIGIITTAVFFLMSYSILYSIHFYLIEQRKEKCLIMLDLLQECIYYSETACSLSANISCIWASGPVFIDVIGWNRFSEIILLKSKQLTYKMDGWLY